MNVRSPPLRRGWTTGACATAALKAALLRLWGGQFPDEVSIVLPRGETPDFALETHESGEGWAMAGIIKDAGDDPDVTHGALVSVKATLGGEGIRFRAGTGVGMVTKPGLPLAVGEPAINPKPREMMNAVVAELAAQFDAPANLEIEVSIRDGETLAQQTWNPRLGIVGGLSVLGTTGVVRPFSCSAWIASIHRGVDVARASGIDHVAGCTGATSEQVVQATYALPEQAMLDMGDFAGGLLKYLRTHPVKRLTLGGGIGKLTKLSQGAMDLHSGRSQIDFDQLARDLNAPEVRSFKTALEVYEIYKENYSNMIATGALKTARAVLRDCATRVDIIVIDRAGNIIGRASE